jgi:hypothetical protein
LTLSVKWRGQFGPISNIVFSTWLSTFEQYLGRA